MFFMTNKANFDTFLRFIFLAVEILRKKILNRERLTKRKK